MAEVSLGWDNTRLQAGARGAEAIVRRTTAGMQGSFDRLKGLNPGKILGGVGIASVALATIGAVAKDIIQVTAEFDSLKRGLMTLEGTQEGVTKRFKELQEVADSPGLGLEQLVRGDIRLRAAGISADLSKRAMLEMGNALASVGGSSAELDGVILALTQIASKGKVSAEEINQMAERVPQVRKVMQEVFGTADTEALQKMKIGWQDFISALIEGFEKGPRATVGLEGSMAKLEGSWKALKNALGEPFVEVLSSNFQVLANAIKWSGEEIKPWIKDVAILTEGMIESAKAAVALAYGLKGLFDDEGYRSAAGSAWDALHPTKNTSSKSDNKSDNKSNDSTVSKSSVDVQTDRDIKELESARLGLGEKQFEVFMSHTSALLQVEALQKRIKDLQEKASSLTGNEQELEKIKIEEKIIDLQNRERAIRKGIREEAERTTAEEAKRAQALDHLNAELAIIGAQNAGLEKKAEMMRRNLEIAEEAARIQESTGIPQAEAREKATELVDGKAEAKQADEAEQAKKVEDRRQRELASLNAELAIIEAQNAGLQKKAEMMRRNLEIAEQAAQIQERTGISQAEAIKKATALVDGQTKANAAGDGKRQGTAAERQEAARQRQADRQSRAEQERRDSYKRNFPGLDEWKANQGKPLRDEFRFPGLDQYNAMQDRSRPVGAPMPAANGKPAATQEMPTVENLLQQLINTTESLKEG